MYKSCRRASVLSLPFLLAFATACGGSSASSTGSPPSGRTAALEIVSGNTQTGVVGHELPGAVVVRVKDDQGRPVSGQIVNFRVVAGGGSVFAGAALSDASGIARERWTLGTAAGPQRLEARAVDSNGVAIVFASFDATAVAGRAASVAVRSGDRQVGQQLATLSAPLVAFVSDPYGNQIAGESVHFSPTTGTVSPDTAVTSAAGEVSTVWTFGTELGTQSTTATVVGLAPAEFTAVVSATAPRTRLVLVSEIGTSALVGTTVTVTVRMESLDGVPQPGQTLTISTSGGGTAPATSTTNGDGTSVLSWTLGTAPGHEVLFVSGTDPVTAQPVSQLIVSLSSMAGPPQTLTLQVADQGPWPKPHVITARVFDPYQNPVTGADITFSPAPGAGTADPPTALTSNHVDSAGYAQSTWTPGPLIGDQVLTVSIGGLTQEIRRSYTLVDVLAGVYTGALVGPPRCDGSFSVSISDGMVGYKGDRVAADGSATWHTGLNLLFTYAGQFTVDAEGHASGSGTMSYYDSGTFVCEGTWTAVRN